MPVEWSEESVVELSDAPPMSRAEMFDKAYWNGGAKCGGYRCDQWGAYRDFPIHEVTARHILSRRPELVLEIGAARGYILKRIQDAGIPGTGLEISKHCYMTRVADGITLHDICETPWPVESRSGDRLCVSVAVMEHIPEEFLPGIIGEMARTCYRGLHGIDFGAKDDGNDKTHVTLRPKEWWVSKFATHAPGWPVEIVDKEELERGTIPQDVLQGDGKTKVAIGTWTVMSHHGWDNLDIGNLEEYARQNGYRFKRCDVKQGLPYPTQTVDLIHCSHFLEHLDYRDGVEFLRDCRRVLKPDGAMRIAVPGAAGLIDRYHRDHNECAFLLREFDEINDGCAASPTPLGKLWSLLHAGHAAAYDWETMQDALRQAGFLAFPSGFRKCHNNPGSQQILRETLDGFPCLSLYVDVIPEVSSYLCGASQASLAHSRVLLFRTCF